MISFLTFFFSFFLSFPDARGMLNSSLHQVKLIYSYLNLMIFLINILNLVNYFNLRKRDLT